MFIALGKLRVRELWRNCQTADASRVGVDNHLAFLISTVARIVHYERALSAGATQRCEQALNMADFVRRQWRMRAKTIAPICAGSSAARYSSQPPHRNALVPPCAFSSRAPARSYQ